MRSNTYLAIFNEELHKYLSHEELRDILITANKSKDYGKYTVFEWYDIVWNKSSMSFLYYVLLQLSSLDYGFIRVNKINSHVEILGYPEEYGLTLDVTVTKVDK